MRFTKSVRNVVKKVGLKIPLVVRLGGTNLELGKKILKESGLPIMAAFHINKAGETAAEAAKTV
jgi:succinyl-CoA synthetase beta subunit